jgi:2',3'-cyclic-nucleotide 2'-phosphodiesterase (5'-nucleotidase family)
MRDAGINPLILDAGDLLFSTKNIDATNKNSEIFRANAILEGYQKVGCDAINVGHYEVLNGLSFLREIEKTTDIPFISSNLKDSKSGELLFDPYIIFERGELKIGVIGATDLIPDTMKTIQSSDFIESCNRFAKELKDKVDIVVALVNASRSTQNGLPEKMPNVDFIITSGNTSMSRTNSPQKENGPFLYSCGKQGKYFLTLTLDIKEKGVSFVDVSAEEKKVKSVQKRFDRLQKKDPDKKLEEIYADQENVLNLIKKYREDLKISEEVIASAINTLQYQTNPLNNKVGDDAELLAFVTSSVKTCDALAPKKKPVNQNKNKNNRHKGHDH